jgi:hypothetical protein
MAVILLPFYSSSRYASRNKFTKNRRLLSVRLPGLVDLRVLAVTPFHTRPCHDSQSSRGRYQLPPLSSARPPGDAVVPPCRDSHRRGAERVGGALRGPLRLAGSPCQHEEEDRAAPAPSPSGLGRPMCSPRLAPQPIPREVWRCSADKAIGAFLDCGILGHGFARVRCGGCLAEFLVAFSCKARGLCPSCALRDGSLSRLYAVIPIANGPRDGPVWL